jgi:ribosomal peptide maturation radical SAM protein 1
MGTTPRVLLISPPWTTLNEPSLGLGILKAILEEEGIECKVFHLNLFALEFLRSETYSSLARVFALNDFMFSGVLDPRVTPAQLRLLREKACELVAQGMIDHRARGGIPGIVNDLLRLRSKVIPTWVERFAKEMVDWRPTLIGFTCMFDQTIASAVVAKKVRDYDRNVTIALGGYAVRPPTGDMVLEAFDWIDAVCIGEGEPTIGPLARASTEPRGELAGVPNLLYRDISGQIRSNAEAPLINMDQVPDPNYDDFFADVDRLARDAKVLVAIDRLPIENSRGCWWGAMHHCVFCGIHDDDLAFRQRSAKRTLSTMDNLRDRYGCQAFRFADYILPADYYRTLLPTLVARGAPYELKCELKANLTEDKVRLLSQAGFVEVQPGIESFASKTLSSMDKGVTGFRNVYLLLLGRRYGIVILYNLLYGLPDDDVDSYAHMVAALPHLFHLDPPVTRIRIQVTRYSPLQANPARFGIESSRHEHSYRLIFSPQYLDSTGFDLDRYCYIFEHSFEPASRLQHLYRELEQRCDEWSEGYLKGDADLLYDFVESGGMVITDTRHGEEQQLVIGPADAKVLRACESPRSLRSLASDLGFDTKDLAEVIARLEELGLVFLEADHVLSLALPRSDVSQRRHWWDNYETRWQRKASL